MSKIFLGIGLIFLISILGINKKEESPALDYEESISSTLEKLDANVQYEHTVNNVKGASLKKGEEIVKQGFTRNKLGARTRRISKHFVCTSCHNLEREDPDLSVIDPQARLEYVESVELPFLQGTALYGIVNRNSFYNDDYYKKYGDLVDAARNNLRQSVQLCATECSQGRLMKDWELESVLMYLWSLELKLNDLEINGEEEVIIANALQNDSNKEKAIEIIESKYLKKSPAHFQDPPGDRETRKMSKGEPTNGELIYKISCMYCHENRKYSFFKLDYSKATFRNLKNNLDNYHERSIYQVSRFGTSPAAGKRAYMPQYTIEKMSTQQLEDLKSYIIQKAD